MVIDASGWVVRICGLLPTKPTNVTVSFMGQDNQGTIVNTNDADPSRSPLGVWMVVPDYKWFAAHSTPFTPRTRTGAFDGMGKTTSVVRDAGSITDKSTVPIFCTAEAPRRIRLTKIATCWVALRPTCRY